MCAYIVCCGWSSTVFITQVFVFDMPSSLLEFIHQVNHCEIIIMYNVMCSISPLTRTYTLVLRDDGKNVQY